MAKTNEVGIKTFHYYILAILTAIVFGYFLTFIIKGLIALGKLAIEYWWFPLIALGVLILLKRLWRKK